MHQRICQLRVGEHGCLVKCKIARWRFIEAQGTLAERRARNLRSEVIGIATARMRRQLEAWAAEDPGTAELLERVVRRELDPATAASKLLERQADA